MPDVWPPPPTNQPPVEPALPPKPQPKGGLDSVVASCIGVGCWLLVILLAVLDSRTIGKIAWLGMVGGILGLCGLFFGGTGLIYGLLSWKTRFGRIALSMNAGLIAFVLIVVFIVSRV